MRAFALALLVSVSTASGGALAQGRELPDFTDLAEKQGPAVVNISTTQARPRNAPQFPQLDEDDPFYDFFRRFAPRPGPGQPSPGPGPRQFEQQSLGSGFVISSDGYILTNAHVVAGAKEVMVTLRDKRELPARVVAVDPPTDVALIKVAG